MAVFAAMALSAPPANAAEMLETFAADCVTPRFTFHLGETVCAKVTNPPLLNQYRFQWATPTHVVAQAAPVISSDPQFATFALPASGPFALTGSWIVEEASIADASIRVPRTFTVVEVPLVAVPTLTGWSLTLLAALLGIAAAGKLSRVRAMPPNPSLQRTTQKLNEVTDARLSC